MNNANASNIQHSLFNLLYEFLVNARRKGYIFLEILDESLVIIL